jgi:predicted site-specific integrase-resolvase
MSPARLVATGVAARELGIGRATLARWWADGKVHPAFVTAGGHARWDVADLRRQVEAWRQAEQ